MCIRDRLLGTTGTPEGALPGFFPLFDVVCFDWEDVADGLECELSALRRGGPDSMMCR